MELKVLGSETVPFHFNGERCSFRVDELVDGFWRIECGHGLFREANGGAETEHAESVDEALCEVRKNNPLLAAVMQEAYNASCRLHIAAGMGWIRDRGTFYHLN